MRLPFGIVITTTKAQAQLIRENDAQWCEKMKLQADRLDERNREQARFSANETSLCLSVIERAGLECPLPRPKFDQ